MYKSLAKKVVKAMEPIKSEYTYAKLDVPIKTIDDIPVEVKISAGPDAENKYHITLHIASIDDYACEDEDEAYPISLWDSKRYVIDSITTEVGTEFALEKIFDQVKQLKFDKLSGTFKPKDEMEDLVEMYAFLNTMPNVKSAFEECCVCHDPTQTQTCCGHSLCRRCMFSIKSVRNDEYQWNEVNCPMCRTVLSTR